MTKKALERKTGKYQFTSGKYPIFHSTWTHHKYANCNSAHVKLFICSGSTCEWTSNGHLMSISQCVCLQGCLTPSCKVCRCFFSSSISAWSSRIWEISLEDWNKQTCFVGFGIFYKTSYTHTHTVYARGKVVRASQAGCCIWCRDPDGSEV